MKALVKLDIFNDPIYGFISIPNPFILELINHPYFQRLRRISQMGLSYLVYPGAHHTRFHHALGAMHLMQQAIGVLRRKGVEILPEEENGLLGAILLHDIGHGPFSHAMEHVLLQDLTHEEISLKVMEKLNLEMEGQLDTAIAIFKGVYPKRFMVELVSSQLDMDRLDYLKRDSFYTGVAEGNINAERLISMLTVKDDRLVVEEKGVYSVEKFLMARRFMYWQVYLHKTSLAAEQVLIRIFKRAFESAEINLQGLPESLRYFLKSPKSASDFDRVTLEHYLSLDDSEILYLLKHFSRSEDFVLSRLSKSLLNRNLPAIKLKKKPIEKAKQIKIRERSIQQHDIAEDLIDYFVFEGVIATRTYNPKRQNIHILKENGKIAELLKVSDHLNSAALSGEVKKYFICFPKKVLP